MCKIGNLNPGFRGSSALGFSDGLFCGYGDGPDRVVGPQGLFVPFDAVNEHGLPVGDFDLGGKASGKHRFKTHCVLKMDVYI